jgi:catechol 2,3-dioxygenase-like lactoylglutathione lyase family enzyme
MDLDHFNIRTQKLAETQRFYERILGLTPGSRPVQPLNGAWLYNDRQAVLHLLESTPSSLATGPLDHVAFACTGLGGLLGRLDREGIARIARAIPGTSIVQVQFLDPNGVMVETNFTDEILEEPSASLATDGHTYFAQFIGGSSVDGRIAPIFKRVAQWIGMPARFVAEVSGHSTRVGAAQDLAERDIDLAAITQADGWKSTRMPLQYAEKINAARSGMARAAAASGRDEPVSQEE